MEKLFKNYPTLTTDYKGETIEIQYLTSVANFRDFFINKITVLYGPTETGKTTLLKNIMLLLKHDVSNVFLYSANNKINGDFDNIVPAGLIFDKIDIHKLKSIYEDRLNLTAKYSNMEKEINNIFETVKKKEDVDYLNTCNKVSKQKYIKKVLNERKAYISTSQYKIYKNYCKNDPKLLLILDDISSSINDIFKQKENVTIKKLFYEPRHANISLILVLHNITDLAPSFKRSVQVNIFCDKCTAICWFAGSKDLMLKKQAEAVATEIFKDPSYKMVYNKDINKFYYIVPEIINNFTMCSADIWSFFNGIIKK